MILFLLINLILILIEYNGEFYFILVFIVFMVVERVLGLVILVSIVRLNGNDYFIYLNSLQC